MNEAKPLRVLVFGPQSELIDGDAIEFSVDSWPVLAGDALRLIGEHHAELKDSLPVSRLAINHAFATPDQPIRPDDEVALIGLISGG